MLEARATTGVDASFRSSLEDVVTIVKRLGPYCHSLDDLVTVAQLGIDHDSQLRFLINLLAVPPPKR